MEKQSFKGMTIAVIAGIVAAALLLLLSCLLPRVVISALDRSCEHDLAEALRYAVQGDNGTAYTHILNIREKTEAAKQLLMLFCDHNDVYALTGAVDTALDLAKTDDAAQLIEELHGVGLAFEKMLQMNDADICNIF